MVKHVFSAIAMATRRLFRNWSLLLAALVLYLAMLGSVYWFFATREATVAQVVLTFALALAAPVLWFGIQALAVTYVEPAVNGATLLGALRGFWKLIVVVLPLVLLIGFVVYLLGSVELGSVEETVRSVAPPRRAAPARPSPTASAPWQSVALASVRYLLLGLVLPLASIHLSIAAAHDGLKKAFTETHRILLRAFAPRSILTYAIGFVVFAIVPYFLIFEKTRVASPWLELTLLGVRLGLAILLSLIGWMATAGALSILSTQKARTADENAGAFDRGSDHVAVES